jgi:hypothetical protein
MNHITKLVLDDLNQKLQAGQFSPPRNKIEGILTSPIQTKTDLAEPQNQWATYYLAFFQFEGLNQDIPVIFRLKNNSKPTIPLQAKVLLEGQWADSSLSPRPSFTCSAYEISANPPPPTIKSLREQLHHLLPASLEKQKEWKNRVDYLFKKQKDLTKIEKITKLGSKYLEAYLLLKSASYANYQNNLLHLTTDLTQQAPYLAKISQEIEEMAYHIRAYEAVSKRNSSISDLPKVNTDYQSKETWKWKEVEKSTDDK